jgi:hypothetical protein
MKKICLKIDKKFKSIYPLCEINFGPQERTTDRYEEEDVLKGKMNEPCLLHTQKIAYYTIIISEDARCRNHEGAHAALPPS